MPWQGDPRVNIQKDKGGKGQGISSETGPAGSRQIEGDGSAEIRVTTAVIYKGDNSEKKKKKKKKKKVCPVEKCLIITPIASPGRRTTTSTWRPAQSSPACLGWHQMKSPHCVVSRIWFGTLSMTCTRTTNVPEAIADRNYSGNLTLRLPRVAPSAGTGGCRGAHQLVSAPKLQARFGVT